MLTAAKDSGIDNARSGHARRRGHSARFLFYGTVTVMTTGAGFVTVPVPVAVTVMV